MHERVYRLIPAALSAETHIVALDSHEVRATIQSGGTPMITARQLASAYDLSIASLWRGERTENTMIAWLGDFRVASGINEPDTKPDAVSLLGGGGGGIRWYTTPKGVIGCTSGAPQVCYLVPVEAELPRVVNAVDASTVAESGTVSATV